MKYFPLRCFIFSSNVNVNIVVMAEVAKLRQSLPTDYD